MVPKGTASRIGKLAEIAQELREGKGFEITRLTRIKALCEEPQAAADFAIYIARLAWDKMKDAECPDRLSPEDWGQHKKLVSETLSQMESHVESPNSDKRSALWAVLPKLQQVQGQRDGPYGVLLIIVHNRYVFLVENALRCLLYPEMSSRLGYELARNYAERYDSHYGTGLIPQSAPFVEDIANFWCEYHFGQTLEQWQKQKAENKSRKASRSSGSKVKTQEKTKSMDSPSFDKAYPNIAQWVKSYGWIEIGQDHYSSSLIRVLDEGGVIWESSEDYETIDEAVQALEKALADWIRENMR